MPASTVSGKVVRTAKSSDGKLSKGSVDSELTTDDLLKLHYFMRLTREFEDNILRLYQQGKLVGGAYSGNGNEATAVGSAYALTKDDFLFPLHRDMGAHFVKGQSILKLMLQHLGRVNGPTRGRDGTGHYSDPSLRIYGNISHLGAMMPVACGVALAARIRKEKNVVMTYIGDGGASVGEVHESLMMASVMRLPLILIIENNQYAYSTPISKQFVVNRLSDRAIGYGIPGVTVDGTNVLEVYRVCKEAVDRARNGQGPSLIESITMRLHGHAAHDNAWYVPKKLIEAWKQKDPIGQFEHLLLSDGVLDQAKIKSMTGEIQRHIEEATKIAFDAPYPTGEDAERWVYAE